MEGSWGCLSCLPRKIKTSTLKFYFIPGEATEKATANQHRKNWESEWSHSLDCPLAVGIFTHFSWCHSWKWKQIPYAWSLWHANPFFRSLIRCLILLMPLSVSVWSVWNCRDETEREEERTEILVWTNGKKSDTFGIELFECWKCGEFWLVGYLIFWVVAKLWKIEEWNSSQ